uniref:Uncharacterized protein n=1 Tax=Ditylum brightwellii TaxID=49249 RepID=A0A6V2P4A0_9STRA
MAKTSLFFTATILAISSLTNNNNKPLVTAWSSQHPSSSPQNNKQFTRRDVLSIATLTPIITAPFLLPQASTAYTPDPDPLRESLYFVSRVQEATVQQERFINKSSQQEELKAKMKLTLRLVEKNYKLLDQINYCSQFIEPASDIVAATEAGYEAADALQGAIDFVKNDLGNGPLTSAQKSFLSESMQSCRNNLFVFLKYVPQDKLEGARKRVEEENVANRDEFDGDENAGVYNPVVLPWKAS